MSIILCYHYPCLDGVFSVLTAFLGLKSFLEQHSLEQAFEILEKVQTGDEQEQGKKIKEAEALPVEQKLEFIVGQEKKFELPPVDPNLSDISFFNVNFNNQIRYSGLNPTNSPEQNLDLIFNHFQDKNLKAQVHESIVILMDFYGGSEDVVLQLCKSFKKVIILDHHITFIQKVEQKLFESQQNFYYKYNQRKSGATVTLQFFQQYFQLDQLCSFGILQRLQELLPSIQDDDIKAGKIPFSRDITSGFHDFNWDWHPIRDNLIFSKLLKYSLDTIKDIGEKVNERRMQNVEKEILLRQQISIGGQDTPLCVGYGVCPVDNSLMGDIATRLAEISISDGLDNIGITYKQLEHKEPNMYKVSLRSSNTQEEICNITAEQFGGGGHQGAAAFLIPTKVFRQWVA